MTPLHDLLPWYVNRTLEADESARFEAHLLECAACRDELPIVERMRARLEQEGEALLADHPSPVELVAAIEAEPDAAELAPEKVKQARRHLALCASCGEEARWVLGASFAGAPAVHPAARGEAHSRLAVGGGAIRATGWRGIPAWAWPAAALLIVAAGLALATLSREDASAALIIRPTLVEPTRRAAEGATVVQVAASTPSIHLLFPVDLDDGEFPLRLEVLAQDGRIVHRHEAVTRDDLTDGILLQLALPRRDCPDGAYVTRLTPARGSAIEYAFQLRRMAAHP